MEVTQMEVGYVLSCRDYLVYLDGLPSVRVFDMVENDNGIRGVVVGLYPGKVETWILDEGQIFPGELFKKRPDRLMIPVSSFLLGRAINPLGIAIDGKGIIPLNTSKYLEIDQKAPNLSQREFIKEQLITGVTLLDTLVPIGKGQRQLFMGDAHSGKTSLLIDMIMNQAAAGTICIYASIGKPVVEVRKLIDILSSSNAIASTVIVAASATEPSPLIFLTPQTAMTIAEFFQRQGRDVLVILDDLGVHAKIYREISLLGDRLPGRESYPGDIFYTHAHLLERAGKFNSQAGSGSITAIPVIELSLNDFTTFIPTNLMSMTDGHTLFQASLRTQGQKPAIDSSLSVSRVGRQTQMRIQNLLSQKIRQILAEAADLETVSRFSGELPLETQLILKQKEIIVELINQENLAPLPPNFQVALLGLVFTSLIKDEKSLSGYKDKLYAAKYKKIITQFLDSDPQAKNLVISIANFKTLEELFKALEELVPNLRGIAP